MSLKGFFGKILYYMGFGATPEPSKPTKPKINSTTNKKSSNDELSEVAKKAEQAIKAIEVAKELQTDKGKARYMSVLRNALKKAVVAEAIEEIQKAEKKVINYLEKNK